MSSRSSFLSVLFLCERDYMFGRSIVDYYVTAWRKTIGNHRSFFDRLHSKERNSNGEPSKTKIELWASFLLLMPGSFSRLQMQFTWARHYTRLMDRSTSKKLWLTLSPLTMYKYRSISQRKRERKERTAVWHLVAMGHDAKKDAHKEISKTAHPAFFFPFYVCSIWIKRRTDKWYSLSFLLLLDCAA